MYGEIEFECSHWSVFENAIDMAHIHYLHGDSFGNEDMPQIRQMTCSSNAYGINADFVLHNKPVNAMWEFSKVGQCLPGICNPPSPPIPHVWAICVLVGVHSKRVSLGSILLIKP